MNDLREEIGMELRSTGRIVRSGCLVRMEVRMEAGRLPKGAEAVKQRGCKEGREYWVKSGGRKLRTEWKGITAGVVQQYMN